MRTSLFATALFLLVLNLSSESALAQIRQPVASPYATVSEEV